MASMTMSTLTSRRQRIRSGLVQSGWVAQAIGFCTRTARDSTRADCGGKWPHRRPAMRTYRPKMPTVGVPIAAPRCMMPVSFETTRSHSASSAATLTIEPNAVASTIRPE